LIFPSKYGGSFGFVSPDSSALDGLEIEVVKMLLLRKKWANKLNHGKQMSQDDLKELKMYDSALLAKLLYFTYLSSL